MSAVLVSKRAHHLAPGPPGQWILGSLFAFRKDPLRLLTESAARYGDVVRCKLGPHVIHLLNHPAHIEHVLVKHSENYDRETRSARKVRDACGDGLLSSNGELWKRERQLLQPAFSTQRLQRVGPLTTESTASMLNAWQNASSLGKPIDIITEMRRLTCSVAARALFGSDVEKDTETISQALDTLLDYIWTRLETPLDFHRYLPTIRRRKFRKAVGTLDQIVYRIIAERRRNATTGNDLLSRLLAAHSLKQDNSLPDDLLRDETITMLLAGHETTAGALARAFYLLARHPEVQQRVREEVQAVLSDRELTAADLPQLAYTTMVFQESLRLYPPIWIIERRVVVDDVIGGYHIPANTSVVISPYSLHRHRSFWDDPEVFDPDRFDLDHLVSGDSARSAYLPFGAGAHQCIGKEFAMLESRIILARVMQRFRLLLPQGQRLVLRPRITLGQDGPLLLKADPIS